MAPIDRISKCQENLARLEGFEPPTLGLEGRCSIQLSYRRVSVFCGVREREASFSGADVPRKCAREKPLSGWRLRELANDRHAHQLAILVRESQHPPRTARSRLIGPLPAHSPRRFSVYLAISAGPMPPLAITADDVASSRVESSSCCLPTIDGTTEAGASAPVLLSKTPGSSSVKPRVPK
jgi:hypothetical protein